MHMAQCFLETDLELHILAPTRLTKPHGGSLIGLHIITCWSFHDEWRDLPDFWCSAQLLRILRLLLRGLHDPNIVSCKNFLSGQFKGTIDMPYFAQTMYCPSRRKVKCEELAANGKHSAARDGMRWKALCEQRGDVNSAWDGVQLVRRWAIIFKSTKRDTIPSSCFVLWMKST
ncbi:hypothetical protein MTO96_005213 [Rhipicephalus appendiculatus]